MWGGESVESVSEECLRDWVGKGEMSGRRGPQAMGYRRKGGGVLCCAIGGLNTRIADTLGPGRWIALGDLRRRDGRFIENMYIGSSCVLGGRR